VTHGEDPSDRLSCEGRCNGRIDKTFHNGVVEITGKTAIVEDPVYGGTPVGAKFVRAKQVDAEPARTV
jgi:hypothetical protein